MRGKKEGEVAVQYESDKVVKGKRTFIDNSRKVPRNNFKEMETGAWSLAISLGVRSLGRFFFKIRDKMLKRVNILCIAFQNINLEFFLNGDHKFRKIESYSVFVMRSCMV